MRFTRLSTLFLLCSMFIINLVVSYFYYTLCIEEIVSLSNQIKIGVSNKYNYTREQYKALVDGTIALVRIPWITIPMVARSRYMSILSNISRQFESDTADATIRKQPYGILLSGPPGSGKTTLAIKLSQHLLTVMGEIPSADKIVTLNETDEYQSEYRSDHKVVIFDDLDQETSSVGNTKNPYRKIIDFINNIRKTALNPNLEMKGSVQIQPDIVIITTNNKLQTQDGFGQIIGCPTWVKFPGAIMRRLKSNICADLRNGERVYGYFSENNPKLRNLEKASKYMELFNEIDINDLFSLVEKDFIQHMNDQESFIKYVNDSFEPTIKESPSKMLLKHMSLSIPMTIKDLFRGWNWSKERQIVAQASQDSFIKYVNHSYKFTFKQLSSKIFLQYMPLSIPMTIKDLFRRWNRPKDRELVAHASQDENIKISNLKSEQSIDKPIIQSYNSDDFFSDHFNQIDLTNMIITDNEPSLSLQAQFYIKHHSRRGGIGYDKSVFEYIINNNSDHRMSQYYAIFLGGYIEGSYSSIYGIDRVHLLYGNGPSFDPNKVALELISIDEVKIIYNIKQRESLTSKIQCKRRLISNKSPDDKDELVAHSSNEIDSKYFEHIILTILSFVILILFSSYHISLLFIMICFIIIYIINMHHELEIIQFEIGNIKLQKLGQDTHIIRIEGLLTSKTSKTFPKTIETHKQYEKDFDLDLPSNITVCDDNNSSHSTQLNSNNIDDHKVLVENLSLKLKSFIESEYLGSDLLIRQKELKVICLTKSWINPFFIHKNKINLCKGSCPSFKECYAQMLAYYHYIQGFPEDILVYREVSIEDVGSCDLVFYNKSTNTFSFLEAKIKGDLHVKSQSQSRCTSFRKVYPDFESKGFCYTRVTGLKRTV